MLSIKNLTTQAEQEEILHDVSINFDTNKVYAIMGVNGSGKSSLAKTMMGDTTFTIVNGGIFLNAKNINDMRPDERAKIGIFLSPQSPLAIPGVTINQLLRSAIPRSAISNKDLIRKIKDTANNLDIPKKLLARSLNENFSGGERKKMEVLQAAILNPQYIILDEIDTGVDVDALKIIAKFLKDFITNTDKTLILITHYNRILSHLPVDEVIVMNGGKITQTGNATLAEKIERTGYQ